MRDHFYAVIESMPARSSLKSNSVLVPCDIVSQMSRPTKARLKFGLKEKAVNLIPDQNSKKVRLSKELAKDLNIFDGMDVCVKYKNDTLILGPLVGILINDSAFQRLCKGKAGNKRMRLMNAASRSHIFAYFFTADNILWADRTVRGTFYNHNTDSWEVMQLPLPDILYDRGGGFSRAGSIKAMEVRKQLNNFKGLRKVNAQHYFSKWDLYCRLSKYDDIKKYLPDTMLYENVSTLKTMLNKHDMVYLKSCTGSNGREIIRVKKLYDSSFEYDYYKNNVIKIKTDSLHKIADAARRLMHGRKFIVQQGIESLSYNGNKVDLRALIQKSYEGEWLVTSLPVRIASDGCPVTSTKSGSSVYKFEEAFFDVLKFNYKQVEEIRKDIYELLSAVADAIQKEYGSFGEMGIDILIDNDLKLWFIESNSKPAKDTVLKSGTAEEIIKAYQRPFEYAKYLSGFYDSINMENKYE
jgi:hypothetical protein